MHLTKVFHPFRSIIAFCFTLTLIFGLISCSSDELHSDERPLVVSTIFPSYDFARNVAGDHAEVKLLVDVTDSHSYSPSAADMLLIEESDVFIYTGGEGDRWAEDFLSTIDCTDKIVINMLETVDFVLEESDDAHHDHEHDHDHDHEHDHEHGDEHDEDHAPIYDEHVWLAPTNAAQITKTISDALCMVDPDCANEYQQGYALYSEALDELDEAFETLVSQAKRKTILVADRFPFRYLCEAYGLSYAAALPGCSSAADLTAVEYELLAERLKSESLPVIFTAEYSDGTIARTVKRESGRDEVKILNLHSCHTLTVGQINDGNSYLLLMRENIQALKSALG